MSKTFANLQVGVRMYLDEANQADFLDTEVQREINYAYHDLISKVVEVYEDFYVTTTPKYVSTVASQQEYNLDSGLIKINRVEINYSPSDPNSQAVRATAIKMSEIPLNLNNTSNSAGGVWGSGYYVYGPQGTQKIGFIPIPANAGTNNVSVWGIVAPDDMSDSSDTVNIPYPDRFGKLIEIKAASELLRKGQQEETHAQQYFKNYLIGCADMQTFLKERQADGAWMIEEADFGGLDFENPLGTG